MGTIVFCETHHTVATTAAGTGGARPSVLAASVFPLLSGQIRREAAALKLRIAILVLCLALAGAGIGLGFSTAFEDDPTRDERIAEFERTITASERRINRSRTQIALLTQTPQSAPSK